MGRASPERNLVTEAQHILVVDDDRRIRELIKSYLMENGFLVSVAGTAAEARERMRGLTFDLLVLDIMMPGETGLTFTKSLRSESRDVPILMLSALTDTDDRIAGLATGSDDYLAKPFEPRELLLRIKNLLRRVGVAAPAKTDVRFGGFQFNVSRGELRKNGDLVRLTSGEKDLLRMLSHKSGTPLSRLELSQPGSEESARSVDVQINRLRQKIESDPANPVYLQTVRGAGYALYVDEEVSGMSDYYFRFNRFLERHLPTGLYYRSLIIVIAPIVLLQTIMAGIILERHWDNVTKVLGRSLAREIGLVTDLYDRSDKSEAAIKEIEFVANKRLKLGLEITRGDALPAPIDRTLYSLVDDKMTKYLERETGRPFWINSTAQDGKVEIQVEVEKGLIFRIRHRRGPGLCRQYGSCC